MSEKHYAIVDVETTGGSAARDKVIEIGIVVHDGQQALRTFHSLINPERYVPYGITQLTGITQEMVQDAPKFYEIAREIVEITEHAIFVGHNVRFDYSFLREEFQRLGFTYSRKTLCTVRLSRKAFPGFRSYSLGNLIQQLAIPVSNRHRALDDALATARILELILDQESNREEAKAMINLGIREALLPKNLSLEKIHALPEACGVYYFHDQKGEVIYVGKSINIKKRVAEHFADKTEKAGKLQQMVHDISYELTGSELVALLLESNEIKRLRPSVNRAQRVRQFPHIIYAFQDEAGYWCFNQAHASTKARQSLKVIAEFPKVSMARSRLQRAMELFDLCGRLCHVQPGNKACFNYHLKKCRGACVGMESVEEYNSRADEAISWLSTIFSDDFFILDRGRNEEEYAVVLVENGAYQGYGYVEKEQGDVHALRDSIQYYTGNPETTRIIQGYLDNKGEWKIVPLRQD
ncbi:MAG TPA: exonuclease domain-containing protein [Saprospiraceae bacterium]|nr:exonuclease domain-containing protein [Saprospiraceae bacterium]HMQ85254.1 exonuclease domain-containing protein [Saprospiraceae bacterium]